MDNSDVPSSSLATTTQPAIAPGHAENPLQKHLTWAEFQETMPLPIEAMIGLIAGIVSADMSDEDSDAMGAMLGAKPQIVLAIGTGPNAIVLLIKD